MAEAKTEAKPAAKAADTVRIKIPIDPLNKNDLEVPVTINGVRTVCKRGETIDVPAVVAEVLGNAGLI